MAFDSERAATAAPPSRGFDTDQRGAIDLVVRAEPRIDSSGTSRYCRLNVSPATTPATRPFGAPPTAEAFEDLVDSAQALYGVPDDSPRRWDGPSATIQVCSGCTPCPPAAAARSKPAQLGRSRALPISFTTSAGVHGEPLAEYALFGLLAGASRCRGYSPQQRTTHWSDRWAMGLLSQQRVLLVGLGGIGQAVAAKLAALGVTVVGTSRSGTPVPGVHELVHPDYLADAARDVDGIVVSLPGPQLPKVW